MLAMLVAEGLALKPDVVTFYEGVNDCVEYEPRSTSAITSARNALARHSLLFAFLDNFVPISEAVDTDWWWSDELAERRSRKFLGNLQRIADVCHRRGIRFIVATQQVKSFLVPDDQIRGVSYDQEVAIVRDKLGQNEIA